MHTEIKIRNPAKFPPQKWHNRSEHHSLRVKMVENIISLLTIRSTLRSSPTDEIMNKVPYMSMRLEEALYHEAPCFEEYYEFATLNVRLQQLAIALGK